jgi:hypothetical protein
VVDSFHRLLSIWIRIRNVPKQQRYYLLGLHGYKNFFANSFPNHTYVHRTIKAQMPTYNLQPTQPDFDILQAIRTKLNELPIQMDIAHVKGHQDRHKLWQELDIHEKINVLADRQANAIYKKPLQLTELFPTWIPGTRAALFHGEQQVEKGIPVYIWDAAPTPALKEYLIRHSKEATGCDKSWDEAT